MEHWLASSKNTQASPPSEKERLLSLFCFVLFILGALGIGLSHQQGKQARLDGWKHTHKKNMKTHPQNNRSQHDIQNTHKPKQNPPKDKTPTQHTYTKPNPPEPPRDVVLDPVHLRHLIRRQPQVLRGALHLLWVDCHGKKDARMDRPFPCPPQNQPTHAHTPSTYIQTTPTHPHIPQTGSATRPL